MSKEKRQLGHTVFRPEFPRYLFVGIKRNTPLDLLTLGQHICSLPKEFFFFFYSIVMKYITLSDPPHLHFLLQYSAMQQGFSHGSPTFSSCLCSAINVEL